MKAKSIRGQTPAELGQALEESMQDGFKPTLAIVFMSVKQDRGEVVKLLDQRGISIYGATSNGEFIDEELGKESIAVLLLNISEDYFKVFIDEYIEKAPRDVAREIAKAAIETFDNPAFLIAGSHMATDAEQLLHGFEDVIGSEVEVYGGMAGDDFTFTEQFVFTNERASNQGVVAVAIDSDKIKIAGRAICGWKPMGTEKTVTKSEGNHVYTIDDVPVLEMTRRYSGLKVISKENENILLEIATTFPLQLQREKGAPIMRPGLMIDWEDGSFFCSGTVPQGSKVRFSLPPDFDVIDEVVDGCQRLKEEEMPEADAVILFSCAGRILAFGPLMGKEIEGVKNVWNAPIAGMFSNAELGRATGGNLEMHNLTTCFVAMKEK